MNKAILIGNLTKDPIHETTPSGINVCKFSIAVNRRFANADGTRACDFLNIITWRGLADNCEKFLRKGSKVGVCGQIQTRTYDAKDGTKRSVTEIIANEVDFLSPRTNTQQDAGNDVTSGGTDEMVPVDDANLPF